MPKRKTYSRLFRLQFVEQWLRSQSETTFQQHCERFGVSRQAAYEWLAKYSELGVEGLETQSSAPHSCPHTTNNETTKLVTNARLAHPSWGPKKLKVWLERTTSRDIPAPSTIGDILKRAGLISSKRRRPRTKSPYENPLTAVASPNDVWTTDFKGQFATRDGQLCYPLTLADCFSRYVLRCDAYLSTKAATARRSFEAAFKEYGLPCAIRSDNGAPFASRSVAGISALSVWWIRLGITPERIAPGSPWQNGRHERMHRTLKAEATQPPQGNTKQQQRAFDSFRREFNEERPHEALGQRTPSTLYTASGRDFPRRLSEPNYPDAFQTRKVSSAGIIGFDGRKQFLSSVLSRQTVGLRQIQEGYWDLFFCHFFLGRVDCRGDELMLMSPSESLAMDRRAVDPRRPW